MTRDRQQIIDFIVVDAAFNRFMKIYNSYKDENTINNRERFIRGTRIINKRVKYEF